MVFPVPLPVPGVMIEVCLVVVCMFAVCWWGSRVASVRVVLQTRERDMQDMPDIPGLPEIPSLPELPGEVREDAGASLVGNAGVVDDWWMRQHVGHQGMQREPMHVVWRGVGVQEPLVVERPGR